MGVTVALAGDSMFGRGVAAALREDPDRPLFAPEIVEAARAADLFVLNLECCVSDRAVRPDPTRMFTFRAPSTAVRVLRELGVTCVTLANNHVLDFGRDALLDTFAHLDAAGIRRVGAGRDLQEARTPVVLEANGLRLAVLGVTDHPAEYAADGDRPGTAFADLRRGVPPWLVDAIAAVEAEVTLVTPHWGPNMVAEPLAYVRRAARALLEAGATVVAGHSAHVFHGVEGTVLYDLGDFLDDYAVDRTLRNDLGLLFLLTLERSGPTRLEAVPLKLEYCSTRPATGEDRAWIVRRFSEACARFGTEVLEERGKLVAFGRREGWR